MSQPSPTLDPRQVRTHASVHQAALEVLRREGLGGTTMDAIATVAGIARSTLYRNWSTRNELLAAAIDSVVAPVPIELSLSTYERLRKLVNGVLFGLQSTEWGRTLPSIVAAIAAEPALSEHYHRFTESRRAVAIDIVEEGIRRRDLPARFCTDDFVDALVGPLFYRRLVRNISTTPAWARRHLDRTLISFEIPARS